MTQHITLKILTDRSIDAIFRGAPQIVGMKEPEGRVEIDETGAEVFRVLLGSPAPQFYADAKVAAHIVFAQCGLAKMLSVTKVLPGMVAGVSGTIDLFRDEFDPDD